ncbi:MAG TPA: 50S ribosomal protein L29 [Candidatus Methanoperedens sp.]|nr:50S ribosomal protein L29 [Candidatus Methanoperedens sp.]
MKKTDKIAYKQKSTAELNKLLAELKKKYIESKSKQYLGNQKDTSVFKKIQSEIALILTLLNQNDR